MFLHTGELARFSFRACTYQLKRTHRPHLRERLHEFHAFCVDLDEGQQIPGLDRLEQLDHLGCRGRARLPRVLVVHIFSVYELLPHRPVQQRRRSVSCLDIIYKSTFFFFTFPLRRTHMSLDGVGFGEGEERFPSMISLKLLFPTFLASCRTETKKKSLYHTSVLL